MFKVALAFAATSLAFAAPAAAQNIVVNPSFETNASWNAFNFGYIVNAAHSGVFSIATACIGPACTSTYDSGAFFEQLLATTAGQSYDLSFWVAENGGPTSSFSVFWNGALVNLTQNPANNTLSNPSNNVFGTQNWVQFSFLNLLAPTNSTELQIHGQQNPAGIAFDDISVTASRINGAVPEPATWAMMLIGFGGIGVTMRRRRPTTRTATA